MDDSNEKYDKLWKDRSKDTRCYEHEEIKWSKTNTKAMIMNQNWNIKCSVLEIEKK